MRIDGVKINYGLIDQSISEDTANNTASSNSAYSNVDNTMNKNTKKHLAYLEKDYFLLDGSYILPQENTTYNVGWESESISDVNGNINDYIEYIFSHKHDSYGVAIQFPKERICQSFKIRYYQDTTLLSETVVNNNTEYKYRDYNVNLQWNKVRLDFYKVNPQQRAGLHNIVFGINKEFTEDDLISVSGTRKTDLSCDYDDSGEVNFSFFNDGELAVDDLNNLPVGLQEGLKILLYIKQGDTFVPYNKYYSESTRIEENGKVITIDGYDEIYRLNSKYYQKGIVHPQGQSLADWAREVANDIGVDIVIGAEFETIISYGYITEVPHREAFRLIAEAGCGMLFVDSNGKIHIERHTPTVNTNLTNDDIVDGTLIEEEKEKILGVQVNAYQFIEGERVSLGQLEKVGVTAEPQTLEVVYSIFPAKIDDVVVQTDTDKATISNVKTYSDRVVFDISGIQGEETWVTVLGTPYNSVINTYTAGSEVKNIKMIESNYLITPNIAQEIANYQYSVLAGKYIHNAEIVSDTNYDLGDKVLITEKEKPIYVTEIGFSLEYGGQTETIKGVDK